MVLKSNEVGTMVQKPDYKVGQMVRVKETGRIAKIARVFGQEPPYQYTVRMLDNSSINDYTQDEIEAHTPKRKFKKGPKFLAYQERRKAERPATV